MSILIDRTKKVLIQGITGREGMARSKLMRDYGTRVVAGCTPGKGGQEVLGLPVFDTVSESVAALGPIDISVIFVPAPLVKAAAIEAFAAGIKLCVLVPDRVPLYDVLELHAVAAEHEARFIGPNTLGLIAPGEAVLGMMGGRASSAKAWFKQGNIGVTSRSGGMTSSLAYYLSQSGVGLSTIVHVGGDPIVGMPHDKICLAFEEDPQTEAIVMFGEIGGSQEERVAALLADGRITKPIIAYIGGKAAKEGVRFSHAGAIVEGGRGTHAGKIEALRRAGATVVDDFAAIPAAVSDIIQQA
jgi:succinyl-CoA synthetase alpha subunit